MNIYSDLETPCFIFDEGEFIRGVVSFQNALLTRLTRFNIGYSVKTNSLPYALQLALKTGCMAEVVSHDEYQLAIRCGFTPQRIIYNGPMKSKETFIESVVHGAVVNIETKRELQWLTELPSGQEYNIGLRLNINISKISPKDAESDNDNSRFGFSDDSGEFSAALKAISTLDNVRLAGIHIHRTCHSRSPRFYEHSIDYACKVIKKYGLDPDYLDIGGGYFGIFHNKPTFADYAAIFARVLKSHGLEALRIIVEPGNALTASSFKFLTEVIDTKRVDNDTVFATTDGSRNDIDPFFRKNSYIKNILYKDSSTRRVLPEQIITGCTCLEYDRLFTLYSQPELEVGDRIIYHNVGAYTMTLSPQFIRFWPRVYALAQSGAYTLVRPQTDASDLTKIIFAL